MIWFKKKVNCSHRYSLVDYYYTYTPALDIEDIYEIRCDYCSCTRNVDKYTLNKLKELKLMGV